MIGGVSIANLVIELQRLQNQQRAMGGIRSIYIDEQNKVVVVIFKDNKKQVVRCSPDDEFDYEVGVALAIARHQFGSKTQLRKFIANTSKVKLKLKETKKPKGGKK